jgi:hypothetical protein
MGMPVERKEGATLLLALALLAASCGDDSAATTTTAVSTTSPVTTTAPAITTTVVTTTTTTEAATTTITVAATTTTAPWLHVIEFEGTGFWVFPPVLGSPGDSNGSGCSPPGDDLPDGVWFGYAEAVSGGVISFDLACYFTGDAAAAVAAAGECDDELGPCIRNQNPKLFAVPIVSDAEVYYIEPTTQDSVLVSPGSWPVAGSYLPCPGDRCGVWLYVNGGVATGIWEMFAE